MFYINIENATRFVPLEEKREGVNSEKPYIRNSRTSSTTLKSLHLQSNSLPLATPPSFNLSLSDRDINTLKSVEVGDPEDQSLFERWALSKTFPEDIKPSQLYHYFVYLLGHKKGHSSLSSIATKLRAMALDGSLDPRKVSALATTLFANSALGIPVRHLESQRGKIRLWVVMAVLVSAIAWALLRCRP